MPRYLIIIMPALLTRKELGWLSGKDERVSKSFEYKMKSSLRKKIRTFFDLELPLLVKNGFFHSMNELSYSVADSHSEKKGDVSMTLRYETLPNEGLSLGKAKVPGPNPGQGLSFFRKGGRNGAIDNIENLQPAVRTIQYVVSSKQ